MDSLFNTHRKSTKNLPNCHPGRLFADNRFLQKHAMRTNARTKPHENTLQLQQTGTKQSEYAKHMHLEPANDLPEADSQPVTDLPATGQKQTSGLLRANFQPIARGEMPPNDFHSCLQAPIFNVNNLLSRYQSGRYKNPLQKKRPHPPAGPNKRFSANRKYKLSFCHFGCKI